MAIASLQSWLCWALFSALITSLTAIFAKVGRDGAVPALKR